MASKNITIVVTIVLVGLAFWGGIYLPKLFKKEAVVHTVDYLDEELAMPQTNIVKPPVKKPILVRSEQGTVYKKPFIFTNMDALRDVPLSEFRGKLVILTLWKTTCAACIAELRGVIKAKKYYADQPVVFIPLSLDVRGLSPVHYFLKGHKLDIHPLYMDGKHTVKTQRKVTTLPETLFIGPSGKILASVKQSVDWESPKTHDVVNKYLANIGLVKK